MRTLFAAEAPGFLRTALPGLDREQVRFVPRHVVHAASACRAAPFPDGDVLVPDRRAETASHRGGRAARGEVEPIAWEAATKPRRPDALFTGEHAQHRSSVQHRLEEVLLDLTRWLQAQTGHDPAPSALTMTAR